MVAGKQNRHALERKRHVVGGVARRRHRFEPPTGTRHDLAIGERDVGMKVVIAGGIERACLADMERPRRPVRPLPVGLGARRRLDAGGTGRVIPVRMSDQDMGDGLAAHRIEQRRPMGLVDRAGIDDGDSAAAHDVAHGALEGERPRIVAEQSPHPRDHLFDLPGRQVEAAVEGDVLGHGALAMRLLGVGMGFVNRFTAMIS